MNPKLQLTSREVSYLSLHLAGEAFAAENLLNDVAKVAIIMSVKFPEFDATRVLALRKKLVAALPNGFCPNCGVEHEKGKHSKITHENLPSSN